MRSAVVADRKCRAPHPQGLGCDRARQPGSWPRCVVGRQEHRGPVDSGAGALPVVAGLLVSMVRDLLAGRLGVDAVAFVSMSAALVLGEALAGVVVAVMYAGGNVLEDFAVARAERDLKSLVTAHHGLHIGIPRVQSRTSRSSRLRSATPFSCAPAK